MSEFDNYRPNSNKSRAESASITSNESEKRATKVVTNPVKVKKNELRKVADALVPGDVTNIKSYIFMDVLVPAFKKLVSDIITNSVDMLFYGETGRSRTSTNASRVSYRSYYDQRDDDRRYSRSTARMRSSYDDVSFKTRGEAEEVLSQMEAMLDRYKLVRVADLYDMAGITHDYTDNDYGWTNLRSADIVRTRDGWYMIRLPRAVPID